MQTTAVQAHPPLIRVLLITNRDSDNLGDQVIEACDIALIKTAVSNLGFDTENLEIDSSALGIVSNKYCETDDEALLSRVYEKIQNSTVVLFGGAPVFSYAYKWFYKKTATILRIAKELNKPVLFSAVGIDAYDDASERCQLLKKELHNGSVVQITTRDGIEHLHDYARPTAAITDRLSQSNASLGESGISPQSFDYGDMETVDVDGTALSFPIGLVSDPAVFTRTVFAPSLANIENAKPDTQKKRIGLFVFRAGGFSDNRIAFNRDMQRAMWKSLCQELQSRGYDYELLTSGHFADEAFLQSLIDDGVVPAQKCVTNINTPENLLSHIRSYDGVVTCRLHPSIISFAYDVPSVSLIWNSKVTDFYRHIGYPERAIPTTDIVLDGEVSAICIVDALESAMNEGITKNNAYVESVYATLTDGLATCLGIDKVSYQQLSGQELLDNMYSYEGTTLKKEQDKIRRKFTRCYRKYIENQLKMGDARAGNYSYKIFYHSGGFPSHIDVSKFDESSGEVEELASRNIQYRYPLDVVNNASSRLSSCGFTRNKMTFVGWKLRFRVGKTWFWCLEDGGLIHRKKGSIEQAALFKAGDVIPRLPVRRIDVMVAEAVWQSDSFQMRYNSGRTTGECSASYGTTAGVVDHLASGSVEFSPNQATANSGQERLMPNRFSYPDLAFAGWRLRVKENDKWYWYCDDGSLVLKNSYDPHKNGKLRIFAEKDTIPVFTSDVETVVAEAVWKPKVSSFSKVLRRLKR